MWSEVGQVKQVRAGQRREVRHGQRAAEPDELRSAPEQKTRPKIQITGSSRITRE